MAIESNASPGELDSPFYIENKAFCEEFEEYMLELGGVTTGSYNAWSYNVKGRVDAPLRWIFQLKKATYSAGTILVSTKKQALQFWTIWKCKNLETSLPDFQIRKKKFGDGFRGVKKFKGSSEYRIISKQPNHPLTMRLFVLLEEYFSDQSLLKITYQENELVIQIDTEQIPKNKFKELIAENFTGL
ncbi:MAG: hypothetical protein GQ574_00830 [Crocinitomix sp.]|nr:hypothetical protein [Crocinitomix sp.]